MDKAKFHYLRLFFILIFLTVLSNHLMQYSLKKSPFLSLFSFKAKQKKEFQNEAKKFKYFIQYDCDSKVFIFNQSCFSKLLQFDSYILNPNRKQLIPDDACEKCLILPNATKASPVYYHTFWNYDQFDISNEEHKNRLRMINLNLMSYLATQNLCCTKFILWKLSSFSIQLEKIITNMFDYYIKNNQIEIRTFTIEEFCNSGFFKKSICSSKGNYPNLHGRYLVALSDMIRFAVLDKYPGIYTDGDTIYLKDMRFFWYINFAYRWSFLTSYNTAVMGFNKLLNPSINQLLNSINTVASSIENLINDFHPASVSNRVCSLNKLKTVFGFDPLIILHSYFFNGQWLCNDGQLSRAKNNDVCGFSEFSNNVLTNKFDQSGFFRGAFAFHIHYKGNAIVENSYFFHFERHCLNFINHLNYSFYYKFHNLTKILNKNI